MIAIPIERDVVRVTPPSKNKSRIDVSLKDGVWKVDILLVGDSIVSKSLRFKETGFLSDDVYFSFQTRKTQFHFNASVGGFYNSSQSFSSDETRRRAAELARNALEPDFLNGLDSLAYDWSDGNIEFLMTLILFSIHCGYMRGDYTETNIRNFKL